MRKTMNLYNSGLTDECKAYIVDGGADSIVLWAPAWMRLEPTQGQVDESQWASLDAGVAWAREHKLPVFIAVLSNEMPAWLGPWSPHKVFLWRIYYLRRIMLRYPHATIIPLNEPDYADIPAPVAAHMMREAAAEAHATGHKQILAPATATLPYALKVLWHLRGYKPPVRIGFAHHQYIDVGKGQTWVARSLLVALKMMRWRDGQRLWLTEGGYIFPVTQDPGASGPDPATWHYKEPLADQEAKQFSGVLKHFLWAKSTGKVMMWATYEYKDSLWGGWASGLIRHDGTHRSLYSRWKVL